MRLKSLKNKLGLFLAVYIAYINPAYAYLDPGTGSLLLQGLLGGIAGATVIIKIYWHKIVCFFKGKDASENLEDDENK